MVDMTTVALSVAGTTLPALTGFVVKLYGDVRVLRSQLEELRNTAEGNLKSIRVLDTKQAVMEGVGSELRALMAAFKDIPTLLARVEAMLESDRDRIARVEQQIERLKQA